MGRRVAIGVLGCLLVLMSAWPMAAQADNTGTDPTNKYAWGENVGWANAAPTNYELTVHFDGEAGWLSGYLWGENVGWICAGAVAGGPYANTTSNDWGVNLSGDGALSGYAWGENIGWLNFSNVTINTSNGAFSGYAWGENIGWVSLSGTSPDYGVRTLAFDAQAMGTPNWWLDHHGVLEGYDAGDGVPAWQKFVMDTDPNVAGDYLQIIAVSNLIAGTDVTFSPTSTQRYYTLTRRDVLAAGSWSNVAGQIDVKGLGGGQALQDTNTAAWMFYAVEVKVEP